MPICQYANTAISLCQHLNSMESMEDKIVVAESLYNEYGSKANIYVEEHICEW